MTKYVQNGGTGDDLIQNSSWTTEDLVISDLGEGNDKFVGWGAAYDVSGGDGNDTVQSGFMGGISHGGNGDDTLWAQAGGGSNSAFGEAGDDFLWTCLQRW